MTSLARFVVTIAILAGLVYGAMIALTVFVEPQQREIVITVPPGKLGK